MKFLRSLVLYLFLSLFLTSNCLAIEEIKLDSPCLRGEVVEQSGFDRFKKFIKGKPARDQLIAGMWSKHFSSSKNYREDHKILGVQYKGIWLTRFVNSHNRDVIALDIARTVKEKRYGDDLLFDVGYKIGPMHGYKEGAPNINGFSILPIVCFGLSYKNVGVSMNLVPGAVVSFYTYMNFDMFRKKDKKWGSKI